MARQDRKMRTARFQVGDVVKHRFYPFRGLVFDIDPEFANTEEWWQAIPEDIRPIKDQPYYHLLAENDETEYVAYVSEQNLLLDNSGKPLRHPQIAELFEQAVGADLLGAAGGAGSGLGLAQLGEVQLGAFTICGVIGHRPSLHQPNGWCTMAPTRSCQ